MSNDEDSYKNYGPYLPNIGHKIPGTTNDLRYNNIGDLEQALG